MVARFIVLSIGGSLIVTPPLTGGEGGGRERGGRGGRGGGTPADVSPIISRVQQSPLLEGNRASSCGLQSALSRKNHTYIYIDIYIYKHKK